MVYFPLRRIYKQVPKETSRSLLWINLQIAPHGAFSRSWGVVRCSEIWAVASKCFCHSSSKFVQLSLEHTTQYVSFTLRKRKQTYAWSFPILCQPCFLSVIALSVISQHASRKSSDNHVVSAFLVISFSKVLFVTASDYLNYDFLNHRKRQNKSKVWGRKLKKKTVFLLLFLFINTV